MAASDRSTTTIDAKHKLKPAHNTDQKLSEQTPEIAPKPWRGDVKSWLFAEARKKGSAF